MFSPKDFTTPIPPILAAKRRRQLYPFFFSMGPVALCISSVLLIGLMAILYLSQVGQAVAENQQLQAISSEQARVERQDQDLAFTIATEQSPAYITARAQQMGLVPANPKDIQVLVVNNLQSIPIQNQGMRP